jgi:hypothetical protein
MDGVHDAVSDCPVGEASGWYELDPIVGGYAVQTADDRVEQVVVESTDWADDPVLSRTVAP